MTETERLNAIIELVSQYGQIDGSHHKAWVIDQVMRLALEEQYDNFVKSYEEEDDESGEWYEWYTGAN